MGRIISQILALEAIFMLPSLIISLCDGAMRTTRAFGYGIFIALAVSGVLTLLCRRAPKGFYAKEGLFCVGISWVVMSLIGCLPFWISGEIPSFIDAFFEMVSGFSTTGASILNDVEKLSRGVLYWRSFSHWLGGMGVLVFLLALVPSGRDGGGFTLHLLRAESPGPNVGKLVPRMRRTASILYFMYILLTVLNVLFLLLGDMPCFDAVCTALGTAGTGGFGIRNDSIAGYSPYIQNVCTVFMLLFGVNFNCFYWLILRQFRPVLKNEELRLYILTFVVSTGLIAWNTVSYFKSVGMAIQQSAFQVASIMTTTGYSTTDFNMWPGLSKAIILCLMAVGACAGSTGGGLKYARVILLLKSLRRNIKRLLHPQNIQTIRADGQTVNEKVIDATNIYLVTYVFIIVFSFLLVAFDGFSIETNISAVISCFNNIGPGFGDVGPLGNFGGFSAFSKLVLIVDMLAGRLEIFPILVLFSRRTWNNV